MQGAVQCALGGLEVPLAADCAGEAVKALCIRCSRTLASNNHLGASHLMSACEGPLSPGKLSNENRVVVMEGLARLAVSLGPSKGTREALDLLTAPIKSRLQVCCLRAWGR